MSTPSSPRRSTGCFREPATLDRAIELRAKNAAILAEVIEDGLNGILVDFFDVAGLSEKVIEALAQPEGFAHLHREARRTVRQRFDLARICLPRWRELIGTA